MLREIAARLGIHVDADDLDNLFGKIDKVKASLGGLGAALAAGAFVMFAKNTITAADDLGDMATKLGLSTDELQAFEFVMLKATGSSEGYDKALFFLNKNIGEAALKGGEAAAAFKALGINVKDGNGNVGQAMDILPALADQIGKAGSHAEKTALATKFFGKAAKDIVPLLDQGSEGIAKLTAEFKEYGGGVSSDFVKQSQEAVDQQKNFNLATKSLTTQFLATFMPAINKVLEKVVKFTAWLTKLSKQTNLMKIVFGGLGVLLAAKFLPTIIRTVATMIKFRATIWASVGPWLAWAAAIGFIVLLFDDLYNLIQGNDSVIGRLLDKFGGVGTKEKFIQKLKTAWEDVKAAVMPVIDSLSKVWDSLKDGAKTWVPALGAAFLKAIGTAVKGIGGLISIGQKAIDGDWKGAGEEAIKTSDSIFGKRMNITKIDAQGNKQEISEQVGGLWGMSADSWAKQANAFNGGQPPIPNVTQTNQVKTEVKVINAQGMTPTQAGSAVTDGVARANADALAALKTSYGAP